MKTREEIINSMCYTWRHDFGLDKHPDDDSFVAGMTAVERVFLWNAMAKIFDNDMLCHLMKKILNTEGPLMIEVMIDPNHRTAPKASVYKTKDGLFATRPMEDLAPFLSKEEFESEMLVPIINCDE